MLEPVFQKNDKKAKWLIGIVSFLVFAIVVGIDAKKLDIKPGFDPHIFAKFNAIINSIVTLLLAGALIAIKQRKLLLHKRMMLTAMVLSILFLISYICHHILAGDTMFGGTGAIRYFYFFILITHVFLATVILPFILFTAYRALISEWPQHKKLARITWPIWFYVSATGVLVYLLISPYYT
jgi:putative membrane protein